MSNEFFQRITEAAKIIQSYAEQDSFIRIVSHLDADGLTAASILATSLVNVGALFRIRIVRQLDSEVIQELANEDPMPIIFTDFGSGVLDLITRQLTPEDIVIIDHHEPQNMMLPELTHINPHLCGIDGAKEISGAGIAYLVSRAIDSSNIDLAYLAVVGALGDSQDRNSARELVGLNQMIVEDAVNTGSLAVDNDLLFYGRETRPLPKALSYTTNPYLPGLSGEEDKCLAFLINLKIPVKVGEHWRVVNDLTIEEKRKIYTEIVKLMSSKRLPNHLSLNLIGKVYTLIREQRGSSLRDAREYATLLNACGRMDKSGLGLAIAMGNRDTALDEVQEVHADYRKTLSKYLEWIASTPSAIQELSNIYLMNGVGIVNENMLGTISSILLANNVVKDKPLIAITLTTNNMIKISGRAPVTDRTRNLNLGKIFQEASTQLEGSGGGHDIAAGAQIPYTPTEDIIQLIDQLVGQYTQSE